MKTLTELTSVILLLIMMALANCRPRFAVRARALAKANNANKIHAFHNILHYLEELHLVTHLLLHRCHLLSFLLELGRDLAVDVICVYHADLE